ncbi:MAG TPA: TIGR00282 family metallophosphoesterase [Verrucomicrobiales bacterium]|nr:TIGR00282 family metallophosphoesterase [Verrucomicrobiales bacterium]
MKLLFIGDIVGKPGRHAVRGLVPRLRDRHKLDLVIANGENAVGGNGINREKAGEIFDGGVDIITCGDHLWDQRDVLELLDSEPRFVRPVNYPPGTPGQGSTLFERAGLPTVGIINAQGRTFMRGEMENPFRMVAEEVKKLTPLAPVIFVDFHAEATSEKIAMGRMLDGDVSAVVGTHTHVQTADETIFPGGTAFLCDAGFTGPHDGVIGREWEPVVHRFLTSQPQRFPVAKGRVLLQGIIIEIDGATGKAIAIERVSEAL